MKQWYVVQVYSGSEDRVKQDLELQVKKQKLEGVVGEISIPSVKLKNTFAMIDEVADQRLFPGYVLVEMDITPETTKLIKDSPRTIKFLGGKNPMPLSPKEVGKITDRVEGGVAINTEKQEFSTGGEVNITDGPFEGFVGIIETVDSDAEKLKVMVSIFGRLTPVELNFNQIK